MDLREELAALAHQRWSGWIGYLFSRCTANADGTLTVPRWAVERWKRQMTVHYESLPEDEKESDRREADRYLAVLRREIADAVDDMGFEMGET